MAKKAKQTKATPTTSPANGTQDAAGGPGANFAGPNPTSGRPPGKPGPIVLPATKPILRRFLPPLPVAPKLMVAIAGVAVYGLIASLLFHKFDIPLTDIGQGITILNGIVLGVLLVFRNNAAYDRWWEGRKLWGQLINDTRNLCLSARVLARPDVDESAELGRSLAGFAHALRLHLRGEASLAEISGFADDPRRPIHVPAFMAHLVYERFAEWRSAGRIDGFALKELLENARGLMNICGACERIRNTPLAHSYRALLRHGTLIYAAVAPVYTVAAFGPWGLPLLALVFYFLIGIEMAAEDIEDPFGYDGDDLSLDSYCRTIDSSVAELLLSQPGEGQGTREGSETARAPHGSGRTPGPAPTCTTVAPPGP